MAQKELGNLSQGICFILSAPAGTGKTTLVHKLVEEFPNAVALSVSTTTREIRPREIPDQHYHFTTVVDFEEKIRTGEFLEYAKVFDNYYGTSREQVSKKLESGKHVVLVIDTQGALQLQEIGFPAVFIFISPPSIRELKERLVSRQTETVELIEKRLSWAREEMAMADHYDYHIINDDLPIAYKVLRSIMIAEEHKR